MKQLHAPITRRAVMTAAIGIGSLAAPLARSQSDASWPSRPIKIIVPFPAGVGADVVVRTIASRLGDRLGQAVVIENKPGAGGNIGIEQAARSPGDGYTLLASTSNFTANPSLYQKVNFDPIKDFSPVVGLIRTPAVLVVPADSPSRTVDELLARIRATPGGLAYASGGNGSPAHLTAELFKSETATRLTHVPFKGSAPAVLALVGGQIELSFTTIVISMPQVKSGRLQALAVTSPQRSLAVPALPTMIEAGIPGFESQQWFGLFAPAALPKDIVARLHGETRRIMEYPDIRERLAADGGEPIAMTTDQFTAFIRADAARWMKVIKTSGASAD